MAIIFYLPLFEKFCSFVKIIKFYSKSSINKISLKRIVVYQIRITYSQNFYNEIVVKIISNNKFILNLLQKIQSCKIYKLINIFQSDKQLIDF